MACTRLCFIGMPPPCPPLPLNSTRIIDGAAMASTTPISSPSASKCGPCSMWSSTNAAMEL